jgi:cytidine deaminase
MHMNPELVEKAKEARQRALAPYSGFMVGAAIETRSGQIYTGCNIENASYGLSICAERVALWKALSEGAKDFRAMAIVSNAETLTSPCGACRQLLWEYCGDMIYLHSLGGSHGGINCRTYFPSFDNQSFLVSAPGETGFSLS